jgi:hypothetical protein
MEGVQHDGNSGGAGLGRHKISNIISWEMGGGVTSHCSVFFLQQAYGDIYIY